VDNDFSENQVTFDPLTAKVLTGPTSVAHGSLLTGLACPTAQQCTATDFLGSEFTFDPVSPGSRQSSSLEHGQLNGLACPSPSRCAAVDATGRELAFDPASSGHARPIRVDGANPLNAVACFTERQCTAVGGGGRETTFDPASDGSAKARSTDGKPLLGVACPAAGQCTATDGNGQEVTFNPTSASVVFGPTVLDSGNSLAAPLTGISCPSAERCTAVDEASDEFTFNPLAPHATWTSVSQVPLTAVACPSQTRCTAVDDAGHEVTFAVRTPGNPRLVDIDGGNTILALSCPSTAQCTAVDASGQEVTFAPLSGQLISGPASVDTSPLNGISCPAAATCVAVDARGGEVTFNPRSPGAARVTQLVGANVLTAVDCPSVAECVAVDQVGDGFVGLTAPVAVTPPTLSGPKLEGHTLTAQLAGWGGAPSGYSYVWKRCNSSGAGCSDISGATGRRYTLVAADVGHTLRVVETARNRVGSTAATSGPTKIVAPVISARTLTATGIHQRSAALHGVIDTGGVAVSWRFKYGSGTPTAGTALRRIHAGRTGRVHVRWRLTGLSPGTTYQFQLVATAGFARGHAPVTSAGQTLSFTTP
jgi:hypothetical protein